jgi:hypothetical protein
VCTDHRIWVWGPGALGAHPVICSDSQLVEISFSASC